VPTSPLPSSPNVILDVVIELLEDCGYDGWALKDVAERAHASLATIYKQFPSRDDLIIAAVERWMEANVYRPIHEPEANQTVFDALAILFRTIFEPWEQHPNMLQVFVRASAANGGDRLRTQGQAAMEPLQSAFGAVDRALMNDVNMILTNVVEGALNRYVNGKIAITEILDNLERTVSLLSQVAPRNSPRGALVRSVSSGTSNRRGQLGISPQSNEQKRKP
jgi:TetR/AcrR family transcriptional regulator, cholesterol catabolism regulator